jgi:hypothetical protein
MGCLGAPAWTKPTVAWLVSLPSGRRRGPSPPGAFWRCRSAPPGRRLRQVNADPLARGLGERLQPTPRPRFAGCRPFDLDQGHPRPNARSSAMFAPAGRASVVAYRGIIGDAGIVAAFDCLPHRLDQSKQPFLILPRHTALADKAAQRDQRDRFDAHLSRCRRVNLGLHGGDDLLLGRRRHLVSSSKSKRGPAEPPADPRA